MTPDEAALRLEWTSSEFMLRWLRRLPDVTVTRFGDAWATRCADHPDIDFLNTVHRLRPGDAELVPAIVEHYRSAGCGPWFELMPEREFGRLAGALSAAGGRHTEFFTMLEQDLPAAPGPAPEPPVGVEIAEVGPGDEDFIHVLPTGHDVPAEHLADAIDRTRHQARVEDARRYVASVDGTPAAAAVLLVVGELAYLANASTLPAWRRRGCQGALIRRRLADAAGAGCRRACVIAAWASQSHANLAAAGFRVAYTKAVWRIDAPAT
ncbi:MAG TPA: GNAT family N-acetyltransferase [Candidatus Dormibacteraeota bacterium]|nr:GNAT family N-acetyltransferase [Candidatus Dormibacteraeota bacterium]